jgi:hypothetical protein
MKVSRFAIALTGILFMTTVACTGVSAEEKLEKRKAKAASEIDNRIQKLQEHKGCISSASTPDALKQCRDARKESHQAERVEMLEKRKSRIDERMKNRRDKIR